jgi:hypothetical protein
MEHNALELTRLRLRRDALRLLREDPAAAAAAAAAAADGRDGGRRSDLDGHEEVNKRKKEVLTVTAAAAAAAAEAAEPEGDAAAQAEGDGAERAMGDGDDRMWKEDEETTVLDSYASTLAAYTPMAAEAGAVEHSRSSSGGDEEAAEEEEKEGKDDQPKVLDEYARGLAAVAVAGGLSIAYSQLGAHTEAVTLAAEALQTAEGVGDEHQIRAADDLLARAEQAMGVSAWAAEAAREMNCGRNGSGGGGGGVMRVANLAAAQLSMERMDDLIEAAEDARLGLPIAVGEE